MAISRVLQGEPINPQELYELLSQIIGKYFESDSRYYLVREAFNISDKQRSASIKDIQKILALGKYLQRINTNPNEPSRPHEQYAFCLAVICHPQLTSTTKVVRSKYAPQQSRTISITSNEVVQTALNELTILYSSLKTPIDEEIKALILKRQQALKLQAVPSATPVVMNNPSSSLDGKHLERKSASADLPLGDQNQLALVVYQESKVLLLLSSMQEQEKHAKLSIKKYHQAYYFKKELKNLNLDQLKELNQLMEEVQQNGIRSAYAQYFTTIREERINLFGGGNTDTWREMRTAVKQQILRNLIDQKGVRRLDQSTYQQYGNIFNQHAGRWYGQWGSTDTAKKFKKLFPKDETHDYKPKTPGTG